MEPIQRSWMTMSYSSICRRVTKVFGEFFKGRCGIKPQPGKVETLSTVVSPKDYKRLWSLLGLLSFHRRFVPGYSDKVQPFQELTNNQKTQSARRDSHEVAMRQVIEDLANADYLVAPDPDAQLVLNTHATQYVVGAILGQVNDGRMEVTEYVARSSLKLNVIRTWEKESYLWAVEVLCDQVGRLHTAKTHPGR
ncbi:putative Pol polyprotein [Gregarina niphandrodes]|uniref:Pol polyprotein n=1 Tax=Gregarina niphandrodes TaxID=110365 RepID=A0A023BAD4_GRENI|nr:putative Pol polyprotein [Gregarina niphandrodes]EZG78225.1 putative Pol polyprotein [Gregarina niphandrodes]|eukprot:XP_011129393.1 putative Pol polyprotein [Gregarina niphandrodes]